MEGNLTWKTLLRRRSGCVRVLGSVAAGCLLAACSTNATSVDAASATLGSRPVGGSMSTGTTALSPGNRPVTQPTPITPIPTGGEPTAPPPEVHCTRPSHTSNSLTVDTYWFSLGDWHWSPATTPTPDAMNQIKATLGCRVDPVLLIPTAFPPQVSPTATMNVSAHDAGGYLSVSETLAGDGKQGLSISFGEADDNNHGPDPCIGRGVTWTRTTIRGVPGCFYAPTGYVQFVDWTERDRWFDVEFKASPMTVNEMIDWLASWKVVSIKQ